MHDDDDDNADDDNSHVRGDLKDCVGYIMSDRLGEQYNKAEGVFSLCLQTRGELPDR